MQTTAPLQPRVGRISALQSLDRGVCEHLLEERIFKGALIEAEARRSLEPAAQAAAGDAR
jgi:hypothetical protein